MADVEVKNDADLFRVIPYPNRVLDPENAVGARRREARKKVKLRNEPDFAPTSRRRPRKEEGIPRGTG